MTRKTLKLIIFGAICLIIISIIFAVLDIGGFSFKNKSSREILSPVGYREAAEEVTLPESFEAPETDRLVVKNGQIYMSVKDTANFMKEVVQYTEKQWGWVVSSFVNNEEEIRSGSITVRVPAESFDESMLYFRGLAEKVTYEETNHRDVTEEYTDLNSNLRNLEAAEKQFLKIMERSGSIQDILAVQNELNEVRSKIEKIKGQIQYLERNVEMATISINFALSEDLLPIPSAEKWRPGYIFKKAWGSLMGSLKNISYYLIWLIVYLVIGIPVGVIIWQGKKFWKKRQEIKNKL